LEPHLEEQTQSKKNAESKCKHYDPMSELFKHKHIKLDDKMDLIVDMTN